MSRILKAYQSRFRHRLEAVGARRLDQGIAWLVSQARRQAHFKGIPIALALEELDGRLPRLPWPHLSNLNGDLSPCHFFCDAGLGGLARWLRASGHKADWVPGIDDEDLLKEGERLEAVVLTTDSLLMERRVVVRGQIPAYWLSPALTIEQQLTAVFREFQLTCLDACCMQCGGDLATIEKTAVQHLIPPRTLLWLDQYFQCRQCGKLFWHGTHWRRIQSHLAMVLGHGLTVDCHSEMNER